MCKRKFLLSPAFFRVLTEYTTETTEWEDYADLGKQAAHDLWASRSGFDCTEAINEQRSMQEAFTAIGYPGPNPNTWVCWCVPDCRPDYEQ